MATVIETNPRRFDPVAVDPVTVDIIENALRNARYEMDAVLFRTAMSPGIREQHDEFPIIADRAGRMVVGQFGSFIDGFLTSYQGEIEEGDVFLTSDPYACDGAISHANDWLVLLPIYREGPLVGWAAMFGHMTDVGGKVPGSLPTDATSIFEEGVVVPPVKLYRRGSWQRRGPGADPQPGPHDRLEPQRPQRHRRRLPDRRPPGPGAVRPLRHRDLPVDPGRPAGPQLPGHGPAHPDRRPHRAARVHRLRLRRRPRLRPLQDPLLDAAGGGQGGARLRRHRPAGRGLDQLLPEREHAARCSSAST